MIVTIIKALDPLTFIIILIICFCTRKKWIVLFSVVLLAVLSELIMVSGSTQMIWGQTLIPALLGYGIQALVCYWLMGKFKKRN